MHTVFWKDLSTAVFQEDIPAPNISHMGRLAGPLPVSELLAETVGLVGVALTRLCDQPFGQLNVDGRLSALWGVTSCEPIGWELPESWDLLSGAYKGADGWIRLHTNAVRHKSATLRVLGALGTKQAVAKAISGHAVAPLEEEILAHGGAAARMIPWKKWQKHPQGRAIAQSPMIEWTEKSAVAPNHLFQSDFCSERPLSGIKVLDLTRVLAGPIATRTLAGFGAHVLRIDPADWDELGLLHDTTVGKRCAELDLSNSADRLQFETLLSEAHILVHGYRPGAMDQLGYDRGTLDKINPAHINVSLSAYGWYGPWSERRGFDSLVQFSAGIAELCSDPSGTPGKLPVQALDHAAGYIMAACCLEALNIARRGRVVAARTSLAQIAWLLCRTNQVKPATAPIRSATQSDYVRGIEQSEWGGLKRLRPPLSMPFAQMRWDLPAGSLRRHCAKWG